MKLLNICIYFIIACMLIILSPATGVLQMPKMDSMTSGLQTDNMTMTGFPAQTAYAGLLIQAVGYALICTVIILLITFLHKKLKDRALY